jgi:hypothetical protein
MWALQKLSTAALLIFCAMAGFLMASLWAQGAPANTSARLTFSGTVSSAHMVAGLTPARGTVHTFAQEAGLKLFPTNRSGQRDTIGLAVFNVSGEQMPAIIHPPQRMVDANESGEFAVVIPMSGMGKRAFRICVRYRDGVDPTQCGEYSAIRVN